MAEEVSMMERLTCPSCKEVISPPAACCENGHFVCTTCRRGPCPACGSCFYPNKRNVVFDKLLREVYYPCENQGLGCTAFFKREQLKEHQVLCLHQLVPCAYQLDGCSLLVQVKDRSCHEATCKFATTCRLIIHSERYKFNCDWRGHRHTLQQHVRRAHSKVEFWCLHNSNINVPELFTDPLSYDFKKTQLLALDDVDELFYIHCKVVANSHYLIGVQYIGQQQKTSKFLYTVEIKHKSKIISFENEVLCPSLQGDAVFQNPRTFEFSMSFLYEHFSAERMIDYTIKITPKPSDALEQRRRRQQTITSTFTKDAESLRMIKQLFLSDDESEFEDKERRKTAPC